MTTFEDLGDTNYFFTFTNANTGAGEVMDVTVAGILGKTDRFGNISFHIRKGETHGITVRYSGGRAEGSMQFGNHTSMGVWLNGSKFSHVKIDGQVISPSNNFIPALSLPAGQPQSNPVLTPTNQPLPLITPIVPTDKSGSPSSMLPPNPILDMVKVDCGNPDAILQDFNGVCYANRQAHDTVIHERILTIQIKYLPLPFFDPSKFSGIFYFEGKAVEAIRNVFAGAGIGGKITYMGTVVDTETKTISMKWLDESPLPLVALGAFLVSKAFLSLLIIVGAIGVGITYFVTERDKVISNNSVPLQLAQNEAGALDALRNGEISEDAYLKIIGNINEARDQFLTQQQLLKETGFFGQFGDVIKSLTPLLMIFLAVTLIGAFKK